jgi:phosphopantothenoylcysteine decarboxylase/phosphopantothenate--cysteine ligase
MKHPNSTDPESGSRPLDGREILVGVCGGIAAYKTAEVVSQLVQRGAGVTVAMTRAARRFVGPTTFEALSGRRVLRSLWQADETADCPHIRLTRAADVTLVAPATANVIGKIAAGIADEIVTTLVISAGSPVVLAPAMNDQMWHNSIVQENIKKLQNLGFHIIPPGEGWLACRTVAVGRMAEPAEIVEFLVSRIPHS